MPPGAHAARGRIAAAVLTTVLVGLSALPAAAAGDPAAQVAQAQQRLNDAKRQAQQADSTLGAAQQNLAAAQGHLADLTRQVAAIDALIATDDAAVKRLDAQEQADKQQLADMLRTSYKHGLDSPLLYVLGASDLSSALQRQGNLSHIADKSKQLMQRINDARSAVQKARDDATTQRAALAVAQQQATATAELVSIEAQRVQLADVAAWNTVDTSKAVLADAVKAKKLYDAAVAAAAAAAALQAQKHQTSVFPPVAGVTFTVDTDLTAASGETADRLNSFLQGTALQGLGGALVAAEQQYHVSARYLLAHAILESAWGTSRIAQDKHNLYGYGADDAHPYQNAYTFPSFAACVDFVARVVAKNYLSPSGPYYHGPTLRGMNVNYASDPYWADSIARIGRSIP
ncbi:MAG TPA: glucosaminidase domain-containing protein [Candidatus Dormibacteraeota bacterium]|jgi:beta-N-acetylglucosaminidase|nr:glucosaminidase domain-containing protein [Candidatus Dormibacteraeota bacterium]